MSKPLWETDHPYYAEEGNYYSNGCHAEVETWTDFLSDFGDDDLDMNLVYRWDWNVPDPNDYGDDEEVPTESLSIFYVGQRKALLRSVAVSTVERSEEPEIRAWLAVRAEHLRKVWEPLLP